MKIKTTIYLVLIALLFGLYILYYEKYTPTTHELEIKKNKPFTIALDQIFKFNINNTHSEKILIKKDEESESWSMLTPLHVEGDGEKIEEIVHRLETIKSLRTISDDPKNPIKIDNYDLRKPRVELTFLLKDRTMNLKIGRNTPLGENMYAMVDNDSTLIHLLPNNLLEVLNLTADDLRNKKVTYFDVPKTIKLTIQKADSTIIYIKKEDGWYLQEPFNFRADNNKIESVLSKLANTKIVKFVDNDPSLLTQYGLAEKDRTEITAYETRKKLKRVLYGKLVNEDEFWGYVKAYDKNYIYLANHEILYGLPEKVEEWRDKRVMRFDHNKIDRMKIKFKDKILSLNKNDSTGWAIIEPVSLQADEEKVYSVFEILHFLTTEEFVSDLENVDLSKYGLDTPEGEISIYYKGQNEPLSLFIGKRGIKRDKIYLKTSAENSIFVMTMGKLDGIFQDYVEYKDRALWNIPKEFIIEVVITKKEKIKKIEFGKNRQWMTDGRMVNPEKLDILLSAFSKPKALKYVTLKIDSQSIYGLDKPAIVLSFKLEDKSIPARLLIGNKTKFNTYNAQIEGKDEVFVIGGNLHDLLLEEY
ncbi:DUF4340 domain-containing protein [Candidatus Poribacteria bacterium]|nr:DUF4340 domain-containing protein [Candidatus Poribacteria bacterium]